MDTQTKDALPLVSTTSLEGDCATPHVASGDVDKFMELASSGLVPIEIGACAAVQNGYMFTDETTASLETH